MRGALNEQLSDGELWRGHPRAQGDIATSTRFSGGRRRGVSTIGAILTRERPVATAVTIHAIRAASAAGDKLQIDMLLGHDAVCLEAYEQRIQVSGVCSDA